MRFNRNDPADCDCIMYDGSAWQSHRDQLLFDGSDLYCVSAGKRAGVLFVEMMVGSVARNSSQRVTVTRPRIEWRFRNRGKRSSHWLELTIDWNDEQLVAVKRRWNEEEVDGPNVERSRNRVGRFTVRSESCVAVDCLRDLLYAIVVLSLFCLPVSGVSVAILPLFPRYWFFFFFGFFGFLFCFVFVIWFIYDLTWRSLFNRRNRNWRRNCAHCNITTVPTCNQLKSVELLLPLSPRSCYLSRHYRLNSAIFLSLIFPFDYCHDSLWAFHSPAAVHLLLIEFERHGCRLPNDII